MEQNRLLVDRAKFTPHNKAVVPPEQNVVYYIYNVRAEKFANSNELYNAKVFVKELNMKVAFYCRLLDNCE